MSRNHPHAGRARGVSLIELMVALVLGLIITGSALTLALTQRQTFTATEDMGQVQESVRLAFELMSRELRGAGGNPCNSTKNVYSALNNPGANWFTNWATVVGPSPGVPISTGPGLFGYGGATAFGDAPFGVAEGNRIAGTDAIEIKSAVPLSADVAVLADGLSSPFDDTIEVGLPGSVVIGDLVADGDLLMICNFVNLSVFRVTGLGSAGANSTIEHGSGMDDDDNLSNALPLYDQSATEPERYWYNEGSIVSRVRAERWFVGANGVDTDNDGNADGRSLYRSMMINDGGDLDTATDEITRGVTDMQVSYLVRGALDYVDASAVADFGDGANPIIGVRIQLTLSGDDRIGPNGERLQRVMTHTVAIRGRAQ